MAFLAYTVILAGHNNKIEFNPIINLVLFLNCNSSQSKYFFSLYVINHLLLLFKALIIIL